ncbi:LytR/AlgR family response regulator transcription factor [Bernardetia sp.]|uniref:LytR/AlgR family response regulator transcription factor n=1 Tax=Bernardetia sp. TaxID=1937974 RepID=UPI0025BA7B6E|nr:LytTR family DNA-binding domain-containing protein [Bernardetia sp.]
MQKLKTFIVEDEPLVREEMIWHVTNNSSLEFMGSSDSVKGALEKIPILKPDLLLLDIQLSDGTSFEILNQLPQLEFRFIFVTAFEQHTIKAIRYGAFDYLLKPVNDDEFAMAIERLREKVVADSSERLALTNQVYSKKELTLEDMISISSIDFIQMVSLKDIIFCESDSSYTKIHLKDNKIIVASKTLKFYEEVLPSEYFLRCHQSYLVNKYHIDKYLKTGYLLLKNGKNITVSVRRKEYILNRLIES